jgi:hypothetical protein
MKLHRLSLKDKPIFIKYLSLSRHQLSNFSFENIYLWRKLFAIEWAISRDNLCIFFRDKIGCFLYLPPLGKKIRPQSLEGAFSIMDRFNRNCEVSRIENVEEKDAPFYHRLGYAWQEKYPEYLCVRAEQAKLKGNRFKSKRACFNYFIKHYKFTYLPFSLRQKNECLKLYNCWMRQRQAKNQDSVYRGMLEDSQTCLKVLLDDYSGLKIVGRVVKIDKKIKALTFGFRLAEDTFCILYEITDLSIKGLAQFIFREFCRELADYKYINIMDDSGLENLKKVKLSYHPVKLVPAYIVKRKF